MLILTKVVSLPNFGNFAVDFATAKDGRQDSVFSDERGTWVYLEMRLKLQNISFHIGDH
jgi:hypothetical protein